MMKAKRILRCVRGESLLPGHHLTETFKEVQKVRENLHQLDVKQWKQDALFTWEWWILAVLSFVPLIIWWKLVDKNRAYEIAFYGCMINIMALILDDFGTSLTWWGYPIKLIPFLPPLLTADSILVPIILMLVYQYFSSSWLSLFIANLIAAAFLAFVAEPVFIRLGFYQLNGWKLIYSFIFYIASSALARLITVRIVKSKA
jgi:hypothetical protein